MVTLHQLKQFLVLSEILHFGRAARVCNITQAALSRNISKLETDLGFQLLDREDRHAVSLTGAGQDYAIRCRRLLAELAEAELAARRLSRGESGFLQVHITAGAAVCPEVQNVITRLHRTTPDLRLHIGEALTGRTLLNALDQRKIQAGISAGGESFEAVEGITIQEIGRYREQVTLAIPEQHPVLQGKFPAGLQNSHFLLPDEESDTACFFKDYFIKEFRRTPVTAMNIDGAVCLLKMAAAGLGIGVLPRREALPIPGVVFRDLPGAMERKINLLYRSDDHSPAIKNLLAACRDRR